MRSRCYSNTARARGTGEGAATRAQWTSHYRRRAAWYGHEREGGSDPPNPWHDFSFISALLQRPPIDQNQQESQRIKRPGWRCLKCSDLLSFFIYHLCADDGEVFIRIPWISTQWSEFQFPTLYLLTEHPVFPQIPSFPQSSPPRLLPISYQSQVKNIGDIPDSSLFLRTSILFFRKSYWPSLIQHLSGILLRLTVLTPPPPWSHPCPLEFQHRNYSDLLKNPS